MAVEEIVFWIIVFTAAAAFIIAYTVAMLRLDDRERVLISLGYRDAELKASKGNGEHGDYKSFKIAGIIAESLLILTLAALVAAGLYYWIAGERAVVDVLGGAVIFVQSPIGTVAAAAGIYFWALRRVFASGIRRAEAARLRAIESNENKKDETVRLASLPLNDGKSR